MKKALIIDDELDICFLLSSILKSKNLQVNYVNNLADATISLQQNNPEIVFIDNHLPDGLGIDFIKELKLKHPLAKVAMITAFDNADEKTKAYKNGVDTFITKPFSKNIIDTTITKFLDLEA